MMLGLTTSTTATICSLRILLVPRNIRWVANVVPHRLTIYIKLHLMDWLEKKHEELKKRFQELPEKIGSIIELTPDVWEILWSLYIPEAIYVKNIEVIWENTYKVCCKFTEYKLANIDHVSNVQMQAAFNQALYCAIWLSIRQLWTHSPISYESYLRNRTHTLYRHDERTFRKQLKPGEEWFLTLKVNPVVKKWDLFTISTDFLRTPECFMHGKIDCLLPESHV